MRCRLLFTSTVTVTLVVAGAAASSAGLCFPEDTLTARNTKQSAARGRSWEYIRKASVPTNLRRIDASATRRSAFQGNPERKESTGQRELAPPVSRAKKHRV